MQVQAEIKRLEEYSKEITVDKTNLFDVNGNRLNTKKLKDCRIIVKFIHKNS